MCANHSVEELVERLRTGSHVALRNIGNHRCELSFRASLAGSGSSLLGVDRLRDLYRRAVGTTAGIHAKPPHSRPDFGHRALHARDCSHGVVTPGESSEHLSSAPTLNWKAPRCSPSFTKIRFDQHL